MHVPPEPNVPGESDEKTTPPVGALWVPWSVSVTATWQLVAWLTATSAQVTAVLVALVWTETSVELWLPRADEVPSQTAKQSPSATPKGGDTQD